MWASYEEAMEHFYSETVATFDYRLAESGDNGEFLTWATVELLERGEVVATERFTASTEDAPGSGFSAYGNGLDNNAVTQALSMANAWVEAQERRERADRLGVHPLELACYEGVR